VWHSQQNRRAEGIKKTERVEAGETQGCTGFDNTMKLRSSALGTYVTEQAAKKDIMRALTGRLHLTYEGNSDE